MKSFLKTFVSLLLLVNGIGAIYGGWNLILQPDGSSLHLPLNLLKHAPFYDYLIPGIILFTANGLFSLLTLVSLLFNVKNYSLLIFAQGAILTGWIVVQCTMLQTIHYLHIIYGFVGLFLLVSGWMLRQISFTETKA